jgi:trehalose 6-phosphate phosphatase
VAADVARRLEGQHALLLTDFDGTLAELAPTPDAAVLSGHVRGEIDQIARAPQLTLGVVSGRRLLDVRARVGPSPQYVSGLHGLEIAGPGATFHHYALDNVAPVLQKLAADARRQLAWCPDYLIEDKAYALTCHVRRTPPDLAERVLDEFEALAGPYLEAGVLRLLIGAKAVELLPAVDWHKGRAVEWIRAEVAGRVGRPLTVVYLGDDRTDEDAFAALTDDDVAIGVGERPHTHLIDRRLAGPASVGRFFAALRTALDPRSPVQ